jgi:excisionase family DNA binding protein
MTRREQQRRHNQRLADRKKLGPLDPAQRYNVPEAASFLRISRATLYTLITAGELRIIKEGARVFVPGSEIVRRSSLPAA